MNFKKIYFLVCLLIILIIVSIQLTRALFINQSKDVITNIKVEDFKYDLSSTDFSYDSIINILPNQEKIVKINITSKNIINTKYELYYEVDNQSPNLSISKLKYSDDISGSIGTNDTKTIVLNIDNKSANQYNLDFKVNSGYEHNELTLKNIITNELTLATDIITVDIVDNMIPVTWNADKLIKADKNNIGYNWFDYDNQKWANAVLITNNSRENYKSTKPGTPIDEDDILAYYTYIPRYRYLLWNTNNNINCLNNNCLEQEIKIEFENKTTNKSINTNNGEWLTHPAFTFGNSELNGIWVGKFSTSPDPNSSCYKDIGPADQINISLCSRKDILPRIKPNFDIWRYGNIATYFSVSKSFQTNSIYGLNKYENVNAHLIKNTEWGAVAYLSQSKFGKFGNDDYEGNNKQIYNNNYRSDQTHPFKSVTGCSSGAPDAGGIYTECAYKYPEQTLEALGASTTGNIHGIYDMAGGVNEYVMGNIVFDETTPLGTFNANESSGTWDYIPDHKYYDSYQFSTSVIDHSRGHLGDATRETLAILESQVGAWYDSRSQFPNSTYYWFLRGGGDQSLGGPFSFFRAVGREYRSYGFRTSLVIE